MEYVIHQPTHPLYELYRDDPVTIMPSSCRSHGEVVMDCWWLWQRVCSTGQSGLGEIDLQWNLTKSWPSLITYKAIASVKHLLRELNLTITTSHIIRAPNLWLFKSSSWPNWQFVSNFSWFSVFPNPTLRRIHILEFDTALSHLETVLFSVSVWFLQAIMGNLSRTFLRRMAWIVMKPVCSF